jgi:ribonuclease D
LAIDLEADSLYSYPENVCLVQLSTASANTIIDPLSGREGMVPLGAALSSRAVTKVFHGADYDIRLIKKEYGFGISNVVDTMIAAQLIGRTRVGLADLLQEEFDVQLDKRHQRANWSTRPLPADMLNYATLDTAYLLPLWARLRQRLEKLGRLAWAEEEFSLLEAIAPSPDRPASCFDIAGAVRLSLRERARLQALVELRERTARAWNRPPFKILSDQTLLAWAQSPPGSLDQIVRTPRAGQGILRRLAREVLDALRRAESMPERDCPLRSLSPYVPLTGPQRARLDNLKAARHAAAQRLGLSAGMLASSRTLDRLCRAQRDQVSELLRVSLKQWQFDLLGDELLGILTTGSR